MYLLNRAFLNKYSKLTPKFGFNGLGEIVYKRTYSRLLPDDTYENWHQTVERVVNGVFSMNLEHASSVLPDLDKQAEQMFDKIFNFKFLPPGRGLWAMGTSLVNEKKIYAALNNCAFVSTSDLVSSFSEPFCFLMEASMLGVGVGFDTKGKDKLKICGPSSTQEYQIPDSREGWVHSVRMLIDSYLKADSPFPVFDYSLIRPAGSIIKSFGGTSSGPEPLKSLHSSISQLLNAKKGEFLTSRDITDLMNLIGKCIVSGNVRRSAEIAFGEAEDEDFLYLKDYNIHPERQEFGWTSNNSILANLGMNYSKIAECIQKNGEPGLAWLENMRKFSRMRDPPDWKDKNALGGNPCLEQTLESYELCCLVEVFLNTHSSLDEFIETLSSALLYAKTVTLGLPHWEQSARIVGKNRRIGTSLTGIAQFIERSGNETLKKWCDEGYTYLKELDSKLSEAFGVPESIKITSVKPSGTVSLLGGATPGVHFPHSEYYIRRVRLPSNDPLIKQLEKRNYEIEDDCYSQNTKVANFPVKANCSMTGKSMWDQLEIAALMQEYWADNQVSCTVTFDPDTEGPLISKALDEFQYKLKGISFLPRLSDYPQMPYESISAEKYQEMLQKINTGPEIIPEKEGVPEEYCDSCNSVFN